MRHNRWLRRGSARAGSRVAGLGSRGLAKEGERAVLVSCWAVVAQRPAPAGRLNFQPLSRYPRSAAVCRGHGAAIHLTGRSSPSRVIGLYGALNNAVNEASGRSAVACGCVPVLNTTPPAARCACRPARPGEAGWPILVVITRRIARSRGVSGFAHVITTIISQNHCHELASQRASARGRSCVVVN